MAELATFEALAVRYGTRTTMRSEVFLHHHLYGETDSPIGMDYYFWVVRNERRTIVVDCGFNERSGGARGRTMLCPPPEAMRALGIDPAEVTHVVVTHAHYDHIGNLDAFPTARIVIAAEELAFWTGPYAGKRLFAHSAEADDIAVLRRLVSEDRVDQVRGHTQLVPGVDLIEVGGHTPGQLVVCVRCKDSLVVVASDALHYYEELDLERPFAHVADLPAMYAGFDLLRELTAAPGRLLVAGHDPEVMHRFVPVAGYESLAVRIA
ncbi:N-acyl homoserine lactonase family protein [Nocardioides agariphilus]|uniref:N-acyl homoserine lactonase family protein n=1 Tax=Nocardioides agariphilus TaxID=433664 RepID=A0A930YKQ9_9ACTN|nr:N-acyl homoserine lactonase family protein [Nocardioides agariphilus]MBF4770518.1 N-acyl homoserine lactonase family protein [Nocardioides agariphilus]